ncbi:protein-L-isoaspartate(D-aspartate) O-methyltransferase [Chelativorans sp. AA-79]|uniref:protein-L-isoaspartate(D-aspartate) O-methyltransferase n=1 Tax=Chelativorans sp. AA-79 TaxID=3028735 RepID=UPI0023F8039F|nr:protein-L-isoaspartate(D-aspartate) O-methyltransferase [Chelativorans sp. AA-79]WEX07323.1 protein-L-isoaspartate(D-aspartate) O-methyltransferase [Chelativorans sp. AA-79]
MTTGEEEREGFAAFMLRMRARNVASKELFAAMEATPRSGFVPAEWKGRAWSNRTVPIECGETLESCDLHGSVLNALDLQPGLRVLEIGTGSGYTSAVMARMAGRVLTLDRYRTLCEQAHQRHEAFNLSNVIVRQADGSEGASDGPFDRIVSWAAFEEPPRRFVDCLASGGIMVAPVGPGDDVQMMSRFTKIGSRFEREDLEPVRLQPLTKGVAQAL